MAAIAVLLIAFGGTSEAQEQSDPVFNAAGFEEFRVYDGLASFESVDTATGNLLLSFADLVLPGDAGYELRIERVYNSKPTGTTWRMWDFGIAGVPMRVLLPTTSPPPGPLPETHWPRFRTADGAEHLGIPLTNTAAPTAFRTKKFWVYSPTDRRLLLPSGLVCSYDEDGYLAEIRYRFGLAATVTWQDVESWKELSTITQTVGGETREVSFEYTATTRTMTYGERVWRYTYSGLHMATVQPPTGPPWQFTYYSGPFGLTSIQTVTTPQGGRVTYTWDDVNFRTASGSIINSWALKQRSTSGSIPEATWRYRYTHTESATEFYVYIDGLFGIEKKHAYRYDNGRLPVLAWTRRTSPRGTQVESFEYQAARVVDWRNNDQTLLKRRVVSRDGISYATTYHYKTTNYADYGQAWLVEETGGFSISTAREFNTQFRDPFPPVERPYLPLLLESETVADLSAVNQLFVKSAQHNPHTGFMTSETVYGITRTFEPDARGNIAVERDGVGTVIRYSYAWGVVENTVTPMHTIFRSINPDSTVNWERRGSSQTLYAYDGLFRRTRVTPPAAFPNPPFPTVTNFDDDGTTVTVARGPSWTRYTLDGFGRVIRHTNSVGVQSIYQYDALGRKTFETLPYRPGAIGAGYPNTGQGTTWDYDGLDRVRGEVYADGTRRAFEYSGADMLVIDEEGRFTVQRWRSTGSPDNRRRLVSLTDAENHTFNYQHNALGKLLSVQQPGGSVRSWGYHPGTELLAAETHPEAGTTSYQYDGAGKLWRRVDPSGQLFTHAYDLNGRLKRVDAPDANYTQHYDYDERDNRKLSANSFVTSTFGYDLANRLSRREDRFAGVVGAAITTYTYTGLDQVQTLTYPSSLVVSHEYDSEGRLTGVLHSRQASHVWLTPANAISPSGVPHWVLLGGVSDFSYPDIRYRPRQIFSAQLNITYNYNPTGSLRMVQDGGDRWFEYDRVYRLTNYRRDAMNVSYEYDALGNRTRHGADTYTYHPTTLRANHLQYGQNGQVTGDGQGTYTYTPHLMMETATVAGRTTTYRYDADHLRKITVPATGSTEFAVHGDGTQVLSEFLGVGPPGQQQLVWQRDYIYANSRLVAGVRRAPSINVGFTQASQQVSEGIGTGTVNLTVTTADGQPTTYDVSLQVETVGALPLPATLGVDFQAAAPTVLVPAGVPSGHTVTLSVPIVNDRRDERTERLEIRLSGDGSVMISGAVHTVSIVDNDQPTLNDFDGDGDSDIGLFRPSNGYWYIYGVIEGPFGGAGDIPVPADYDGDGRVDVAVFRPASNAWYVLGQTLNWGGTGDIPVPADYDGDGDADVAVFRPSEGTWYVWGLPGATFGGQGDIPVPADYDGDGDAEFAVFRPSTGGWFVYAQGGATFGGQGDIPVPADYDGDGDTDFAVFRPSNGTWYLYGLPGGPFGGPGDIPVPADYDGDGDADIAVFRPSTSEWHLAGGPGVILWGGPGDLPFCGWPCPTP